MLKKWLHELGQQWNELTAGWWEEDRLGRLHDRSARLGRKLQRHYERVVRRRARIERLRDLLGENEKRLRRLAELVGVYLHVADRENAWRHSLEHAQTRQAIESDTARLRQHERTYRNQLATMQHIQRRLARVQEELSVIRCSTTEN